MDMCRTLVAGLYVTMTLLSSTAHGVPECRGLPADIVCAGGPCNGTPFDDVILGSNGADDIVAGAGNDVVCGGFGADTIAGGPGDDVIEGNRGDDLITGGLGDDWIAGNRGADVINGNRGRDTILGGIGPDAINGGVGDDILDGGRGADDVRGFLGADLLIGGPGIDVCDGGLGDDDHGLPLGVDTCETEVSLEGTALVPFAVTPSDTDALIDDPVGGDHVVFIDPAATERDELLVYLPGTFGTPSANTAFLAAAAGEGMKAIGLQYVNDGSINGTCLADWIADPPAEADCQESLRLERIYGDDTSPLDVVSPANSLVNRLVKLLEHLDAAQPAVGWDEYLEDGAPRWDRIVVAGFSQGSGMAALIARDHQVARVLMFGGPSDFDPSWGTAAWMTDPKATSMRAHFGFRHVDDQHFPVEEAWDDMGLLGPAVIVDIDAPPYSNSRYLETDLAVPPGDEHGSVIGDEWTGPGGEPVFVDTWLYMCCTP